MKPSPYYVISWEKNTYFKSNAASKTNFPTWNDVVEIAISEKEKE